MSTIDLNGKYVSDFSKQSLAIYVNLDAGLRLIGYTQPESTISYSREMMQFEAQTPRVLVAQDYMRVGASMTFTWMQVADPNLLALMLTGDLDCSGNTYDWVFGGSNPNAGTIPTYEWRAVGESRDGRLLEFVIRKGLVGEIGDQTFGGTEYASQQVTVNAIQDDTITNTERDLWYWRIAKRTFS
jgi:hypothetical protein